MKEIHTTVHLGEDPSIIEKRNSNMEYFTRIVKGVSRKYASIYVNQEDLEQELWVSVLTLIRDYGGAEFIDPKFVAKCCFNRAIDIYRYNRRRREANVTLYNDSPNDDGDGNEVISKIQYARFDNGDDKITIKDVINLFPIGSKERKYVVTKLYMYGEISDSDGLPDKLELPAGDTEGDILKLLGYNSKYPASWGKTKYRISDVIYRHLGLMPESSEASEASVKSTIADRVENLIFSTKKGYMDFNRILRDRALTLLGCNKEILHEVIKESSRILESVGPNGDWWALKNDINIIQKSFIEYGYKVFTNKEGK